MFCELVEANRLLMPIEHITAWLYQVARNRITDFFRRKRPEQLGGYPGQSGDEEALGIDDLLPSPDAGPLFGLSELTFWQALGLLALCRILFGGNGVMRSGSWRSEDRDRFRSAVRRRFGIDSEAPTQ